MDFVEKIYNLPGNLKSFFLSDIPRIELEKSCFMFRIPDNQIGLISDIIASVFVGDIQLSALPKSISDRFPLNSSDVYGLSFELNKRVFNRFPEIFRDSLSLLDQWQRMKSNPVISEEEAMRKVLEIEPWLNEKDEEEQENKPKATFHENTEKALLTDAIKKYPEIFEQSITSVPIRSSNFSEPIHPSIKNWLADYTYNLGYESHDTITRGNYMFQSPNTKALSFEDRQKLSYILKSYDEKTPVTVNVSTKQIVFPQMEVTQKEIARTIPNSQFTIPAKTTISNPQAIKQESPLTSPGISRSVYNLQSNNINQPQKALEQNYEHYQIPQRKPDFPSINQSSRLGSSEFKPQENPLPSSQNLTFSSPQKLPFERETEKKYSPPPVVPTPKLTPPPAPPKPVMDMPPVSSKPIYDIPAAPPKPAYGPQPLRISPATMLDENHNEENHKEELPKNVVNLKDNF